MDSPLPKHVLVRKYANEVKDYLRSNGVQSDQEIIVLIEILSYCLQTTESNRLSYLFGPHSARYAVRRLLATLNTISKVFSL